MTSLYSEAEVEAGSRLSVSIDDRTYRLLSVSEDGFAIRAEEAPRLSGFVMMVDAAGTVSRCLVVLAEEERGVRYYEFKQRTEDRGAPLVDYVRGKDAPVALLT